MTEQAEEIETEIRVGWVQGCRETTADSISTRRAVAEAQFPRETLQFCAYSVRSCIVSTDPSEKQGNMSCVSPQYTTAPSTPLGNESLCQILSEMSGLT